MVVRFIPRMTGFQRLAWLVVPLVLIAVVNAEEPAKAPLDRLLENLFGRDARDTPPKKQDAIDNRAPRDPRVENSLRLAESAAQTGNWRQALTVLQRVLDLPEDSLVRQPTGQVGPVRDEANRVLGSLPAQALDAYRGQFGGLARQMLTEAQASGELSRYADVATRFFHTEAGYEAANYLGTVHLDRGEFGMAARLFEQLREAHAPIASDPRWQTKAAYALKLAGLDAANAQPGGPNLGSTRIGGQAVDPRRWLSEIGSSPTGTETLDDWLMLLGTPSRTGHAIGGDPLLLSQWTVPLTYSHLIRGQVESLTQDLRDQGRAPILAAIPLVVDGKVIYRNLRGVQVVDLETGKPLWETNEGLSPERLLTGTGEGSSGSPRTWRFRARRVSTVSGAGAEYQPLSNLLFCDGTYGLVSSDGRQVFVIENQGMLSNRQPANVWGGFDANEDGPQGLGWTCNTLTAYDLTSGHPAWSVGGEETDEPFQLPLAGYYFFGPPTPHGEEVYVVGAKGDELRLCALDGRTGSLLWSQLLAYSDTKIQQDLVRRCWPAQVSAGNGVLICPTTVGWLVGLDQMRHTVLWAHRYPNREPRDAPMERFPGNVVSLTPPGPLNSRWCPSAPVIAGNYVLSTPSESPVIECLKLYDGTQVWQREKDANLYLAGVFGDKILLVGQEMVKALSLENGATLWTLPLTADSGQPSGYGVATADRYYLPLESGALWVIDLETGQRLGAHHLPDDQPPLGNLLLSHGRLLSLGVDGVRSFGQLDVVLAEVNARKSRDAHDPAALLREAQIQLLNKQPAAALERLRQIAANRVPAELKKDYRQALIESLTSVVRSEPAAHEVELEQLGELAGTTDERFLYRQLRSDLLHARKDFAAAFDGYWELSNDAGDTLMPRPEEPELIVRQDLWLAGRLRDVYAELSPADREHADAQIEAAAQDALAQKADHQLRFPRLCGFHPAASQVKERLAERFAEAGEFARAEHLLLRLASVNDRTVAARSLWRLAKLMEQSRLPDDAREFERRLLARYSDVRIADDKTAAELIERPEESKRPPEPHASWFHSKLKVEFSGINYAPPVQEFAVNSWLPYFRTHRIDVLHQEQRLGIVDPRDDSYSWLAPLRSLPQSQQTNYSPGDALGHQLFILHRDVLHALSPIERRILWTRPLETRADDSDSLRYASRPIPLAMQTAEAIGEQSPLLTEATLLGRLAIVNPNYLGYHSRHAFTLVDPLTGETLWSHDGLSQQVTAVGGPEVVYLVDEESDEVRAFRALDGKPLDRSDQYPLLTKCLAVTDSALVIVESENSTGPFGLFGLFSGKAFVRLYDPLIGENRWQIEFPHGSQFALLDPEELLALTPKGELKRVDLHSGQTTSLERIPSTGLKSRSEILAVADDERIYLILNRQNQNSRRYAESIPSIRLDGVIRAFDRRTGKQLWQQTVSDQNLVLDRLRHSPVLVCASRTWEQRGKLHITLLSLSVLGKPAGRKLLETEFPNQHSGFHSVALNLADRFLELTSYNQRLRILPSNAE